MVDLPVNRLQATSSGSESSYSTALRLAVEQLITYKILSSHPFPLFHFTSLDFTLMWYLVPSAQKPFWCLRCLLGCRQTPSRGVALLHGWPQDLFLICVCQLPLSYRSPGSADFTSFHIGNAFFNHSSWQMGYFHLLLAPWGWVASTCVSSQ